MLEINGEIYARVTLPSTRPVTLDEAVLAPLVAWTPHRTRLVEKAGRDQATIVEADATAENLGLSWGQIKTLVEGYEVAGDELAIWRAHELTVSTANILRSLRRGVAPALSVIARGALIEANAALDVPHQAIDYLVRATRYGADPSLTRHRVGGFLAHHGYPWLWVPHKREVEYRHALVACLQYGGANLMTALLIESIETLD
jgi:hypothetical protein